MANPPGPIIVNADADGDIVIDLGLPDAGLVLPLKDAEDLAAKLAVAIEQAKRRLDFLKSL